MNLSKSINCFLVNKDDGGNVIAAFHNEKSVETTGDVTVDIEYSALNYKDALAATGHPGVALTLPLIPGIDAVGTVSQSSDGSIEVGQNVIIAHADFGTRRHGGWTNQTHVPADWCIPVPGGLSKKEAVVLGTAGFTAAQCVESLLFHGLTRESGPVIVTGATGGVGINAVKILGKLGFHVVASTGKLDQSEWLKTQGATEVVDRNEIVDTSKRPLLSAKWAGAVDTVGGTTLESVLRSSNPGACVTACGLVESADINLTVYPFILRGVTLQGIDSAGVEKAERIQLWKRLASDWKLSGLEDLATEVRLSDVQSSVDAILAGKVRGRVIVKP